MRYSIPFTSGVVVVMGVPLVWRNLRRGCTKFLRLTPNGFELEQRGHSQSGDWHQVRDVTEDVPGQQDPTPSAVVFVMSDDSAPHSGGRRDDTGRLGVARACPVLLGTRGIPRRTHRRPSSQATRRARWGAVTLDAPQ